MDDTEIEIEEVRPEQIAPPVDISFWQPHLDKYEAYLRAIDKNGDKRGTAMRYGNAARAFVRWCADEGISPDAIPDDVFDRFEAFVATQNLALVTQRLNRKASRDLIAVMDDKLEAPVVEEVPSTPVAAAPAKQTVEVKVIGPRGGTRAPRAVAPFAPRDPFKDVLPTNSSMRVRVYKRDRAGKLVYLEDYSLDDIGKQPMPKFLKEYVDPQFKDPSGTTTYNVFKVGADEQEIGPAFEFRVESEPTVNPDDPLAKAREAMEMVNDFAKRDGDRDNMMKSVLEKVAEKRAESGSMSDLMALIMMKDMMGGKKSGDEETLMRVLEKLRPSSALPPMQMPMLPSPGPSELAPVVAQLMKTVTEPKAQPTLAEELQKLAALKDIFAPKQETSTTDRLLTELLSEMRSQRSAPGVSSIAQSFKDTVELVKTLAPAVNMGSTGSWLKDVITPAVAQTFAAALGSAASKVMANAPGVIANAPVTAANAPTNQPPAAALPHIQALKTAATEPEQIASTVLILQAYYQDPAWQPKLDPVSQRLLAGDYEPTRRVIGDMLLAFRKDIATKEFAEKVVRAIVVQLRTAGAPIVDEAKMKDAVAAPQKPADVVPFPKKEPAQVAASEASWIERATASEVPSPPARTPEPKPESEPESKPEVSKGA